VISYLLGRYPTVSNTFVYREIAGLIAAGESVHVWALTRTKEPDHGILPPGLVRFVPTAHAILFARKVPSLQKEQWRQANGREKDLRRAGWLARQLHQSQATVLHVHFLGFASALGSIAASIADIPLVITIHARGILVPEPLGRLALAHAKTTIAISKATNAVIVSEGRTPGHLLPLAIDQHSATPTTKAGSMHILTIARAVPKKGYPTLRAALNQLKTPWQWTVAGATEEEIGGPLPGLTALGLVSWSEIAQQYNAGVDIFALACQRAPDGDEDGVPVAILEAMARAVPVVTSPVGGISELITHKKTGMLVPQQDAQALSDTLQELASNKALRLKIGHAGQEHVRQTRNPQARARALQAILHHPCEPKTQ